jgi:hypothetical protein
MVCRSPLFIPPTGPRGRFLRLAFIPVNKETRLDLPLTTVPITRDVRRATRFMLIMHVASYGMVDAAVAAIPLH